MRQEQLNAMLSAAAQHMPPPSTVQLENELKPDPARMRARIDYLELRLGILERWAKAMNPTFWHFQQMEMQLPTEG